MQNPRYFLNTKTSFNLAVCFRLLSALHPRLFRRRSKQRVHYEGRVAVIQMAAWLMVIYVPKVKAFMSGVSPEFRQPALEMILKLTHHRYTQLKATLKMCQNGAKLPAYIHFPCLGLTSPPSLFPIHGYTLTYTPPVTMKNRLDGAV